MALREILTFFGFDFDAAKLRQADGQIDKTKHKAKEAGHGVEGFLEGISRAWGSVIAGGLFAEFTMQIQEQAEEIEKLSGQTGLSNEQTQIWAYGAKLANADAADFATGLKKLSSALAGGKDEAGQQIQLFKKLGIATKDAGGKTRELNDVLPDIMDRFAEMDDGARKVALAQEIFGKSGIKLIPLLNQGREGLAELTKEFHELGGGFSDEAIKKAAEFDDNLKRLELSFTSLKSAIAVGVFPQLAKLVDLSTSAIANFSAWARETTLIQHGVEVLGATVALKLGGALAPYLKQGLKFAAIFLAIDDLVAFLEGKDSLIGSLLDSAFGYGTAFAVRAWVQDAWTSFSAFIDDFRAVLPVFEADVNGVLASINQSWHEMLAAISGVLSALEKAGNAISPDALKTHLFDGAEENQNAAAKKAGEARQTALDQKRTAMAALQNYVGAAGATTGNTGVTGTTAPVIAPTQTTNYVELNAPITVQVPAGSSAEQARAIGKVVTEKVAEERRAALRDLENRAAR